MVFYALMERVGGVDWLPLAAHPRLLRRAYDRVRTYALALAPSTSPCKVTQAAAAFPALSPVSRLPSFALPLSHPSSPVIFVVYLPARSSSLPLSSSSPSEEASFCVLSDRSHRPARPFLFLLQFHFYFLSKSLSLTSGRAGPSYNNTTPPKKKRKSQPIFLSTGIASPVSGNPLFCEAGPVVCCFEIALDTAPEGFAVAFRPFAVVSAPYLRLPLCSWCRPYAPAHVLRRIKSILASASLRLL